MFQNNKHFFLGYTILSNKCFFYNLVQHHFLLVADFIVWYYFNMFQLCYIVGCEQGGI